MTERQLRELREQRDRAHSQWQAAKYCMSLMQAITDEMQAECERLAELIAEHDDTEIVISDESNLDDVVRRAEAGELAMRVDVADIDGETA